MIDLIIFSLAFQLRRSVRHKVQESSDRMQKMINFPGSHEIDKTKTNLWRDHEPD